MAGLCYEARSIQSHAVQVLTMTVNSRARRSHHLVSGYIVYHERTYDGGVIVGSLFVQDVKHARLTVIRLSQFVRV